MCPDGFCVHRTSFRLTTSKGKTNPIFQHPYVINWQHCKTARTTNKDFFNTVTTYLIFHICKFPSFFIYSSRFFVNSKNAWSWYDHNLSAQRGDAPSNACSFQLYTECTMSSVFHASYNDVVKYCKYKELEVLPKREPVWCQVDRWDAAKTQQSRGGKKTENNITKSTQYINEMVRCVQENLIKVFLYTAVFHQVHLYFPSSLTCTT